MRIAGKEINKLNVEVVVVPRPDGDIVFKCQAVLDYSKFDELCPEPKPPVIYGEKGKSGSRPDYDDKGWHKKFSEWLDKRECWMCYQSLKATDNLEWSQVMENVPETWQLVRDEFKNAKFTQVEIRRIFNAVASANGLDEARIEEARESFLRSEAAKVAS